MKRTVEPETVREAARQEAARQVKRRARRAAMDAARARMGLDDRGEPDRKTEKHERRERMYGAWLGRVRAKEPEPEPEAPRAVTPLYLCLGASYGVLAACRFGEGVRTRKRVPYYCGLTYLAAAGAYFLLDCLNRTEA